MVNPTVDMMPRIQATRCILRVSMPVWPHPMRHSSLVAVFISGWSGCFLLNQQAHFMGVAVRSSAKAVMRESAAYM